MQDDAPIQGVEVLIKSLKFVSVGRNETNKWVSDKQELGVVLQLGLFLTRQRNKYSNFFYYYYYFSKSIRNKRAMRSVRFYH